MAVEAFDIIRVIVITSFAGGTSFLGNLISKKKKLSEQKILTLTAFGAGLLCPLQHSGWSQRQKKK